MTRKYAGLTGTAAAFSVGMILAFALLVFPQSISFPAFHFDASPKSPALSRDMLKTEEKVVAEEISEEGETVSQEKLSAIPSTISGLNKVSLSATLYGAAEEKKLNETESTLTSLVLADHLSEQDLGTFEITYQITPEEYEMLLYCVEFETRSGSLEHKSLIAQVIMNRVQGQRFPFTVAEVLMAPGQFDVMPGYEGRGEWEPSERTRQAVDLVLSGAAPDWAQGALYFCNPYIVGEGNWFDTALQTICEIEGHRFYK
ncbi:MAG: cell wall hydrolase [Clostridia bacterium]|nr:cell wall hydrolase [Clostridia bacterium]